MCDNRLGDLTCIRTSEHTAGPDNKGCMFVSSSAAYDRKEIAEEGIIHDD